MLGFVVVRPVIPCVAGKPVNPCVAGMPVNPCVAGNPVNPCVAGAGPRIMVPFDVTTSEYAFPVV